MRVWPSWIGSVPQRACLSLESCEVTVRRSLSMRSWHWTGWPHDPGLLSLQIMRNKHLFISHPSMVFWHCIPNRLLHSPTLPAWSLKPFWFATPDLDCELHGGGRRRAKKEKEGVPIFCCCCCCCYTLPYLPRLEQCLAQSRSSVSAE